MTLPVSRDENAAAGGKVSSTLLNDIQDSIILHESAIRAARDFALAAGPHCTPGVPANWAPNLNGSWEATVGSPDRIYLDIPLRAGDLITGVTVYVQHSTATAGLITAFLEQFVLSSGARFSMSATASSSNVTTVQALTLTALTAVAYTGATTYCIHFDGTVTATTRKILGAKVTYTRP